MPSIAGGGPVVVVTAALRHLVYVEGVEHIADRPPAPPPPRAAAGQRVPLRAGGGGLRRGGEHGSLSRSPR